MTAVSGARAGRLMELLPGRLASAIRQIRRRTPRRFEFAISIYGGPSLFALRPLPDVKHPMLTRHDVTDRTARFVADPFLLRADGRWHMFFEVLNADRSKGEIGLALSDDGLRWRYQQVVLAEPFSVSYPHVFEWAGDFYMIPSTGSAHAVRLYKAEAFPTRWSYVASLLEGQRFADSSVVFAQDRWWLFTGTGAPPFHADTLLLYCADGLTGPWRAHPASPIVRGDAHIARPAGRILSVGDGLIRFAQDCAPRYGVRVRGFEITRLTADDYAERPMRRTAILGPGRRGWNAAGMHHIDACVLDDGLWLAAVDGWCWLGAIHG